MEQQLLQTKKQIEEDALKKEQQFRQERFIELTTRKGVLVPKLARLEEAIQNMKNKAKQEERERLRLKSIKEGNYDLNITTTERLRRDEEAKQLGVHINKKSDELIQELAMSREMETIRHKTLIDKKIQEELLNPLQADHRAHITHHQGHGHHD
ncbi:MAG: hypothetical protein EZS28_007077 [Streblomastix strix]|uniref:Uncharacterized protein n=1 Tax=Streblomastix strix TaxID=222440 RepID=A0A5J4WR43_9EUKA|nr:MAG: hypothetical protein EZS28_007077 [Streblomastix strix]